MDSFPSLRSACDRCTRGKAQCDSGRPCHRCVRLDCVDECIYSVARKRGPQPHPVAQPKRIKKNSTADYSFFSHSAHEVAAAVDKPRESSRDHTGRGETAQFRWPQGDGHADASSAHAAILPSLFSSLFWPQKWAPILPTAQEHQYLKAFLDVARGRIPLIDEDAFYATMVASSAPSVHAIAPATIPAGPMGSLALHSAVVSSDPSGNAMVGMSGARKISTEVRAYDAVGFSMLFDVMCGLGASLHGVHSESSAFLQRALLRLSAAMLAPSEYGVTAMYLLSLALLQTYGRIAPGVHVLLSAAEAAADSLDVRGTDVHTCRPYLRILIGVQLQGVKTPAGVRMIEPIPSPPVPGMSGETNAVKRFIKLIVFLFVEGVYGLTGREIAAESSIARGELVNGVVNAAAEVIQMYPHLSFPWPEPYIAYLAELIARLIGRLPVPLPQLVKCFESVHVHLTDAAPAFTGRQLACVCGRLLAVIQALGGISATSKRLPDGSLNVWIRLVQDSGTLVGLHVGTKTPMEDLMQGLRATSQCEIEGHTGTERAPLALADCSRGTSSKSATSSDPSSKASPHVPLKEDFTKTLEMYRAASAAMRDGASAWVQLEMELMSGQLGALDVAAALNTRPALESDAGSMRHRGSIAPLSRSEHSVVLPRSGELQTGFFPMPAGGTSQRHRSLPTSSSHAPLLVPPCYSPTSVAASYGKSGGTFTATAASSPSLRDEGDISGLRRGEVSPLAPFLHTASISGTGVPLPMPMLSLPGSDLPDFLGERAAVSMHVDFGAFASGRFSFDADEMGEYNPSHLHGPAALLSAVRDEDGDLAALLGQELAYSGAPGAKSYEHASVRMGAPTPDRPKGR